MSNPPPCLFLESLNRSRSFYTSEEYSSWVWGPGSLIFGFHLVGKLTRVYEAPWHAFVTTTCSQLYKYLQQFSSKLLQQNQFDVLLPGCFRMGTAQLQNLVSRCSSIIDLVLFSPSHVSSSSCFYAIMLILMK